MLPDHTDTVLSRRQYARARDLAANSEMQLFERALTIHRNAQTDRLRGQALSDALRASLDEELALLEYGIGRANGSAAKAELVARKVELLSLLNQRQIQRRYSA